MNVPVSVRHLLKMVERESPTILTGLGVTGFITTVILAVRATPKAIWLLERNEHAGDHILSKTEIAKITWKCYIPTVLVGLGSIGCFVGANSISLRRNAVIASLYSLSEAALKEYQQKVIEVLGKSKEEKVHDALVQDKLDKDPASAKEVIVTGKGETLFYDSWSGRYFKTDMETVRRIQNDLNAKQLGGEMYVSLNDLYDELGLECVEMGNHIGWSVDYGQVDIRYTSKIAEGVPCIVMEYKPIPKEF